MKYTTYYNIFIYLIKYFYIFSVADETEHDNISQHQSLSHTSTFQEAENKTESYNSFENNSDNHEELTKCVRDIKDNFIFLS